MSAALQLPIVWGACSPQLAWPVLPNPAQKKPPVRHDQQPVRQALAAREPAAEPPVSLAFYRKHTESLLRRYLYASMQVGRAPSLLSDPVGRGWCSSRRIRTFEDAVIFVLDIEKCLTYLDSLDRQLISRIVLQEYTQAEAAPLLGMSTRTISYKLPRAIDRLTEKLLEAGLLVLPN
jgi:hypothetical protein